MTIYIHSKFILLSSYGSLIIRKLIYVLCRQNIVNGELILIIKHKHNCMLDDGIY